MLRQTCQKEDSSVRLLSHVPQQGRQYFTGLQWLLHAPMHSQATCHLAVASAEPRVLQTVSGSVLQRRLGAQTKGETCVMPCPWLQNNFTPFPWQPARSHMLWHKKAEIFASRVSQWEWFCVPLKVVETLVAVGCRTVVTSSPWVWWPLLPTRLKDVLVLLACYIDEGQIILICIMRQYTRLKVCLYVYSH